MKPESDMSTELLAHVRYPQDLFKAQRAILGSYHVTDAASFYSGDDQWVTPNDPTSSSVHRAAAAVLPDDEGAGGFEARLHAVFDVHPEQLEANTRSILTGYLAANSDPGPNYGKLTILTLPKQVKSRGRGRSKIDENRYECRAGGRRC